MAESREVDGVEIEVFGLTYPMPNPSSLTFKEQALVKRTTGLRQGEYQEAFAARDSAIVLGLTLVALQRAGALTPEVEEKLLDSPVDTVGVNEVKTDPPVLPADVPAPDTAAETTSTPEPSGHQVS